MLDLILFITIIGLCLVHLMRIALFLIVSDIRGVEHFRNHMKRVRNRVERPLVSVVIPTRNNDRTIVSAIESVLDNTYNNIEIIVADYNSIDRTSRFVRKLSRSNPTPRIRFVSVSSDYRTDALNTAAKSLARGTLIMILDPKMMLAPKAIEKAVAHFQNDRKLGVLINNVKPIDNDESKWNRISREIEFYVGSQIKFYISLINIDYHINGLNATYRKAALKRANYFDDALEDDAAEQTTDMLSRICSVKYRAMYGYDVYAITRVVSDFRSYMLKRFRAKYGQPNVHYKSQLLYPSRVEKNSKFTTYFHVPYSVYNDILLTIEPLFALFILVNLAALMIHPGILVFGIIALTFYVSFALKISNKEHLEPLHIVQLLILAPFSWLLFYVISILDFYAVVKNLTNMRSSSSVNFKPKIVTST